MVSHPQAPRQSEPHVITRHGSVVGFLLGPTVGFSLGASVGFVVVGAAVGDTVGFEVVGVAVGDVVGFEVVGDMVGSDVGCEVVGERVGIEEAGEVVGNTVGFEVVGTSVGDMVVGVQDASQLPEASLAMDGHRVLSANSNWVCTAHSQSALRTSFAKSWFQKLIMTSDGPIAEPSL